MKRYNINLQANQYPEPSTDHTPSYLLIGALDGQMPALLNILVHFRVIDIAESDYHRLVEISGLPIKNLTSQNLDEAKQCLSRIRTLYWPNLYFVAGLATEESLQPDYWLLLLLQRLQQMRLHYEIILSPADYQYLKQEEDVTQLSMEISPAIDTIGQLLTNAYRSQLKLFACLFPPVSVSEQALIHISSCDTPLSIIPNLAEAFEIAVKQIKTLTDLAAEYMRIADLIHQQFEDLIQQKQFFSGSKQAAKDLIQHCLSGSRFQKTLTTPNNRAIHYVCATTQNDQQPQVYALDQLTNPTAYSVLISETQVPVDVKMIHDKLLPYIAALRHKAKQLETRASNQAPDNNDYQAATTANQLAAQLDQALQAFLAVPYYTANQVKQLRQDCVEAINTAKPVLKQHRGFKEIVVNLLIVVSTLGIGYLPVCALNYCFTGHFFFRINTDSTDLLEAIHDNIVSLTTPQSPTIGG